MKMTNPTKGIPFVSSVMRGILTKTNYLNIFEKIISSVISVRRMALLLNISGINMKESPHGSF
jgi:hypothetical protein